MKIKDEKALEKFEKWLKQRFSTMAMLSSKLNQYPPEMQTGVYLAYLREKFQVVLCVYTNASGFLWSVQNNGGTDLGWSNFTGDCKYSGTFTTYEKAFEDALNLIVKCSFEKYHKSKAFTHCSNYSKHLQELK
jgi:hypothetical protein